MPGTLKATLKLFLLALWMLLCFVFLALFYRLRKYGLRDRVMRTATSGMLRILGVNVTITGAPSGIRPLLMVSNHVSYLDVVILNASVNIHFTPKIEISGWPVLGAIARMSGSVFIDRRPEKVTQGRNGILEDLARGSVVCVFPEATTGDGLHMIPFKSGFFSLADADAGGRGVTVQPVAVTYSSIRRLPIDTIQWPHIAWYGDMELLPHLWNLLKLAPLEAELVFLEPVKLAQHGNRKALAAHCQKVIDESIQSIRGRHRRAYVKPASFNPRNLRLKS
jgi:1-acyl-sn-glycerol-3-phosphate acyltransferase